MNLSEVSKELQGALSDEEKAANALEQAKAKLVPLQEALKAASNRVDVLMNQRSGLMAEAPSSSAKRGGRKAGGTGRTWKPEAKIAATIARTRTRLLKEGKSKAAAEKAAKAAGKDLAARLGVR